MITLYVALGGAIGAAMRHLINGFLTERLGSEFPYGTMIINITGSLLMGLLVGYFAKTLPHSLELRAFLAVGILGGYTTFSAFSLDTITLLERGETTAALSYIALSVGVSIFALFIGLLCVRSLA